MGRAARPRGMRGGSVKSTWSEMQQLRQRVRDLEAMRERLSRLYFSQVETGKARMEKLHRILDVVTRLNSSLDVDSLLAQIVGAVQKSLGFRIVLLRILDPSTQTLKAHAFAGLSEVATGQLVAREVPLSEFHSWLVDEFRVSRSFFISHKQVRLRNLPPGVVNDLGRREDWEWHEEDVLLVPLYTRAGELMGYLSVDDPVDRLVPSRETIEMLEIFGNHVVVALENARLVRSLAQHGHELEAANHRMGELNQLKSSFLSAVSHELRTPLTSIRAYLDSLRIDLERPGLEQPLRFVRILEDDSRRLSDLIESVLSFSHLDRGSNPMEFKTLDVREPLRTAAEGLSAIAEAKKVSLQTILPDADIRIEADLELLKQLVLHLGGNALKFTSPGGQVRIEARADANHGVEILVTDTGIGIPEDQLDRIFERFYQVDQSLVRRFGGTGLGLALCKSIVEVHGGTISVESSIGEGSKFTVWLPTKVPQRALRAGPPATANIATDADEALCLTLGMAAGILGVERVALLVPERGGRQLELRASVGLPERAAREVRLPATHGLVERVFASGESIASPDPTCDARLRGAWYGPLGAGPLAAVPVRHDGRTLGILAAALTEPMGDEALPPLERLAGSVGAVLANSNRAQEMQETLAQAAEALRDSVTRLSFARVATGDRVKRARALAMQMGLSPCEAGWVAWAAAADEADQVAVDVAGRPGVAERPEEVKSILAHRLERVDGSGTPQGLKGNAIAIGARILAVTSAFETALLGGAKGPARTPADALEKVRQGAGRELDPNVVEALIQLGIEEGWLDPGWALGPPDAAEAA